MPAKRQTPGGRGALAAVLIVVVALGALAAPAAADSGTTIYVDDDWSDKTDGDEVGDGYVIGTNATASIQAAIDNASADDTIVVRDGTYEEQVAVDEGVTLTAENESGATIRYAPDSATGQPAIAVTADGASVSGFAVERVAAGDRDPTASFGTRFTQGIRVSASDVLVEDNAVTGEGFADGVNNKGVMVLDDESGGSGETVANVTLSGNTVSGFAGPLSLAANYGGTVEDVSIPNNDLDGYLSNGIAVGELDGDVVDPPVDDYEYEATTDDYPDTTVYFETESDALDYGANVSGAVVEDPNGDNVVGSGMSIQDAVDAASDGDTLTVKPGTYTEQVTVDTPNVTVRATGATDDTVITSGGTTVTISAEGVTVDGFTVTTTASSGRLVQLDGARYELSGNVLNASSGASVAYGKADDGRLAGNTIRAGGTSNYAVRLGGAQGVLVADNEFVQESVPEASSNTPQSLLLASASDAVVRDNAFQGGASGQAILLTTNDGAFSNVTVAGNDVTGYANGVLLYGDAAGMTEVSVTNNAISAVYDRAIRAVDTTGSADFTALNGEDAPAAQSDALLADNDAGAVSVQGTLASSDTVTVGSDAPADFATVPSALASVESGTTVHVAPGTYEIPDGERLSVGTDDVTLSGAGEEQTVIEAGAQWGVYVSDTQNVTLEGFTVDGVDDDWGSATVKADFSENLTVRNVTAEDGYIGFDLNNVRHATFTDVAATNNSALGVSLKGDENVTFDGLTTKGSPWGGVGIYPSDATRAGWENITTPDDITILDHESVNEPIPVYTQSATPDGIGDLTLGDATHLVENPNHKPESEPSSDDYFAFYLHSESDAVAYATDDEAHADASTATVRTLDRNAAGVVSPGDTFVVAGGMSVQAAVDAAADGDTIDVGAGTFEGHVTLDEDVTLTGAGVDATTLYVNSTHVAKNHHSTLSVYADATVEDLSVVRAVTNLTDRSDGHTKALGVSREADGDATDATVRNVAVRLVDETGDDGYGNAVWVNSFNANGGERYEVAATFENVDATNDGTGVNAQNDVGGAAIAALSVDENVDLTVRNSTLNGAERGLHIAEVNSTLTATFEDNDVRSTDVPVYDQADALDAAAVLQQNEFDAAVASTGSGNVYGAIQPAVDAAGSGGTVSVYPGTYDGSINVTNASGLTIRAAGDGPVLVEPTELVGWDAPEYSDRYAAVRVANSEDIAFEGLIFDFGQVKDPSKQFTGVLYWNSSGALHENTLRNTSTSGYYESTAYVRAPGYTDADRAAVTVTNNTFLNTGRQGLATHGYVNATVANNEFHSADDDFGYAIEVGSESTGAVVNNEIHGYADAAESDGSHAAGLYVENAFTTDVNGPLTKDVLVAGNDIYDNQIGVQFGQTWDTFSANVSIDATFVDNHVHDNSLAGVTVVDENAQAGSSVTVEAFDNRVENNGDTGYHVFTEDEGSYHVGDGNITLSVTGDTITGHHTGILVQDGGPASDSTIDVSVLDSDLSGNDVGVNNTWVEPVDATHNFWGAADGPSGAAPGSGAAVSEGVEYRPWLVAPGGPVHAGGVTFYVDASASGPANGSQAAPYASIDDALAAAQDGDRLFLLNGTYDRSSTLTVSTNNITIEGESRAGVTVDAAAVAGYGISTDEGGDVTGLTVRDLTVVGPQQGDGANYAFKLNPTTEGVTIRNVTVTDSYRTGIDFNGVTNVSIHDVTVSGTASGNGIAFADTRNVFVENAIVENNTWGGIALYTNDDAPTHGTHEVTVVNSTIRNNGGVGVYAQNSNQISTPFENITLVENEFAGNAVQVAELDTSNQLKASADWFDVTAVAFANDFDGASVVQTADGDVAVPAVFSTVQDGVDAASPGEMVLVMAGTDAYDEAVTVSTENVTLLAEPGATIAPSASTMGGASEIVRITGDNVTVQGFDIVGLGDSTDSATVQGVSVVSENVTVANNTVRNVLTGVQTHMQYPTNVSRSDGAVLVQNDVEHVGVGLSVQSNETVVWNNTVSDAHIAGIGVLNGREHVGVYENDLAGIEGPAVSISDYLDTTSGTVEIHENDLGGGTFGVKNAGDVANVNATHNYWGAPTGPSGEGPGAGANVSANVTFEPFYTDAALTELSSQPPAVSDVTLTDLADDNGVVGDGDEVAVSAAVTDTSGVRNVTVDASALGAGEVTLTHEAGDTYTATFAVDAANATAADGSVTLAAVATDASGNTAQGEASITLSTDSTTTTTFTVSDASPLNVDVVDVDVTVENVGDRQADRTVTLVVDGSETDATRDVSLAPGESETVTFQHRFSTGEHTVTVTDGDVTLAPKTVTAERATNPSADVTVTSPSSGEAFATGDATVEFDLSDAGEGIAEVAYDLDDGAQTGTLDVNASNVTLTGLADGSHTVELTLVDHLGNELSTDSVEFDVDNTPPVVTVDPARTEYVSANDSVTVDLGVSDANYDGATFTVENAAGDAVYTADVSDELADGAATVTWDGTDNSGTPVASGDYTLVLDASDQGGLQNSTTATVSVDNDAPAVSVDSVTPAAAGSGETVTVEVTASDAESSVEGVGVTLVADDVNYRTTADATLVDGTWTATFDAANLSVDGDYSAVATATDAANNDGSATQSAAVSVDTTAPTVSAVLDAEDASTGVVNVTVSESVSGAPTVTVTEPDGDDATVSVSQVDSSNRYTGTFALDGSGEYAVAANATDDAGNLGETTAAATISADLQGDDGDVITITGADGTTVDLALNGSLDGGLTAFTSSDTPLAELGTNVGSTFLNGELNENVTSVLDNATIRIPVAGNVPAGVSASDVNISRYNETTGEWAEFETNVTEIDGEDYFVTTVEHFSTYGPVAPDTTAPTIDAASLSPDDGDATYAYDTSTVDVTVEYSDNKQVNASDVTVEYDGVDVTDDADTSVSASAATFTATDLVGSGQHTVTVTVNDTAGNANSTTVSFTVEQDTAPPAVTDEFADTYPYGTDPVPVNFALSDSLSGVNESAVTLAVDGDDVTGPAVVTDSRVQYDASGLAPGTHTAELTVVDEAGNTDTVTETFTVESDGDAPTVSDVRFSPTLTDGALPVGTEQATVTIQYGDAASGIDAGAVDVEFDGVDVTDAAVVTGSELEYTAFGLTNGSTHTLTADVVDSEGNVHTESVTIEVAAPTTDDGGDVGGGQPIADVGGVPDPRQVGQQLTNGGATVALEGSASSLGVQFAESATGRVSADALDARPDDVPAIPDASGVAFVDVTVPSELTDTAATLEFTVDADAVGDASADDLVAYHYKDGEWTALGTSVVSASGGEVVLAADTPGFSLFAVAEDSTDQTTDDETTDQTTDETTDDQTTDDQTTDEQTADDETTRTTTDQADVVTAGPTDDQTREQSGFSTGAIAALALILVAVLGLFLLARRRT